MSCARLAIRRQAVPGAPNELVVTWSPEDDAFVVDVPELPGCMAHGDTRADAVANAQDAISLWLDVAKDMGRPIPTPRGRLLSA